ncbi:hypothetical protein JCM33374_g1212 [Metschnikowia sp. JCM 33374]|nr:hypothetical protein JCM33374_g1212 [Metschnikowia sp. JCM 33374]
MRTGSSADASQDPIMKDLLKIQGQSLPTISDKRNRQVPNYPMEELSLRLRELLELILDPVLPDDSRMHYEQSLKDLISKDPKTKSGHKRYPNDYLSQILIDNYSLFLKISTSYFNLSFSSSITRYLVSIIYNLECWEIYHLLNVIPNLEYILKLLDFDIKFTSFGYIVKPPANFLNFNLRQGLQYPFPYPFYNFSYHSVNPRAASKKMRKISIKPYIDLRLDKSEPKPKSPPKVLAKPPKPVEQDFSYMSDSDQSSADSEDFRRWKIVYLFVEMTPERIKHDFNVSFITPAQRAYEEEDYDSDRARLIEAKEQESIDESTPGLKIVPSVFQKAFAKAFDNGLIQHTFLHQCKLMDPTSHKTCLKVFYGKNELHRHQEFVHATKKRLYRCAYCLKDDNDESKKCYPRYDSLARHIRRKHGIVGRENKQAVLLARKVAETEEIFGGQSGFQSENNFEIGPDGRPEPRATLSSNTGISISLERMYSEGSSIGVPSENHESFLEERAGDTQSSPFHEYQFSAEPRKRKKRRTSSVNDPGTPSNELKTLSPHRKEYPAVSKSGTNKWPGSSTNIFEYSASQAPPEQREAQNVLKTSSTSDATQFPQQFHTYGAYEQNYGPKIYPNSDGGLAYRHPVPVEVSGQTRSPQYPYMGTVYAPPYSQKPPNTEFQNELSQSGPDRSASRDSIGSQTRHPQSHVVHQRPPEPPEDRS